MNFFPVIYEREILKWKEDDAMFVETHNFAAMFDQVKEQTYVMFVGVPGCGKTATARHIALILQTEGYQILPIKDIKDIETYCDPHLPQVFVIDDVIGVFGLDMAELNLLRKYQDRLKCPTMPKTKTLMTCREVVYRNEAFSNTSVFAQDKHVIYLSSSANVLTDTDKCKLLAKYNLNVYQFQVRILPKTSNMFPLLCKLFSKKEEYKVHGYMFFLTPIPCILEAMNEMKTNNRIQYASLVLLMANQNKLSEEDLDDVQCSTNVFTEIKNKVLQKCKVNSRTDSFEFTDALAEMEGTYTKKSGNMFTFEHDYMLEIIAYHFGSQCPEIILQIMKSDYISYYIELDTRISRTIEKRKESEDVAVEIVQHSETKIKQDDIFNLCITLTEKQYPILLERLLKDIKNGDYYNVLRSKVLKHSSVLRQFIGIMGSFINLIKRDRTPLTVACHLGDLNIVEELIKAGAEVNLRDNTHRPLTLACEEGHVGVVKMLIKAGANVNVKDGSVTALSASCELGNIGIIDELITSGADVNLRGDSNTPLTFACEKGPLHLVKKLIEFGADVNLADAYKTPLTSACEMGCICVVEELIKGGSIVNKSDGYNTPLTAACQGLFISVSNGTLLAYHLMFKRMLKPFVFPINDPKIYFTRAYMSVVEHLIKTGADVNLCDGSKTPLTTACEQGHVHIVKELINFGADVNLRDEYSTPLIKAIGFGHLSVVKELIKACANVNLNDEYDTPLTSASDSQNVSLVEELVKAGADINLKYRCTTALTNACEHGNSEVVKKLIEIGADVNLCDGVTTPLTIACEVGYQTEVESLIKAGADINMNDGYWTPLTIACERGQSKIVNILIKSGVDVNLSDGTDTPLKIACEMGHLSVVEALINAGVDVKLCNLNTIVQEITDIEKSLKTVERLIKSGDGISLDNGYLPLLKTEFSRLTRLLKSTNICGANKRRKRQVDLFKRNYRQINQVAKPFAQMKNNFTRLEKLLSRIANRVMVNARINEGYHPFHRI